MNNKQWMCPRCKQLVYGYGATSRRDNKTEICSACGTSEAFFDWQLNVSKQKGNPIPEEDIAEEKNWLIELSCDQV